jgi:hypothetical protein
MKTQVKTVEKVVKQQNHKERDCKKYVFGTESTTKENRSLERKRMVLE